MDTIGPDEKRFRQHVESGPFQAGVDRGRWRLISVNWPYAVISIRAAARANFAGEYALRFQLFNYPQVAPTAQLWDDDLGTPLEYKKWPTGRSRVPAVFRVDWNSGQCLYVPCDRVAIRGHDTWRTQHADKIWSPDGDITQYLRIVYELLNDDDYTGVRCA
jgi:hypothetical protein